MTSNGFVDDPAGAETIIVGAVLSTLATVSVAARLALRHVQRVGWGADDFMIVVALVQIWALFVCTVYAWHNGLGRHIVDVPKEHRVDYLKCLFAFDIIYAVFLWSAKLSYLFLYRRVFMITRGTRLILDGAIAFICLWTFARVVSYFFSCTPISHFWTRPAGSQGSCLNITAMLAVNAALNVVTDLAIYIFPVPIVWKLQTSTPRKVGLIVIFLAGGVVCALSIVRASGIGGVTSKDFTYDNAPVATRVFLEVCIGCITACLPTLGSLYMGWWERVSTSALSRLGSKGYSAGSSGSFPSDAGDRKAGGPLGVTSESGTGMKDLEGRIPPSSIRVQYGLHQSSTTDV